MLCHLLKFDFLSNDSKSVMSNRQVSLPIPAATTKTSVTETDNPQSTSSMPSSERQLAEGLLAQVGGGRDPQRSSRQHHPDQNVQLASSATSSLFSSGVAPTTQLISFSCESPRQALPARKPPSIPRISSHNDIVQGVSAVHNCDSMVMDEEEIKQPVSILSLMQYELSWASVCHFRPKKKALLCKEQFYWSWGARDTVLIDFFGPCSSVLHCN